MIILIFSIAIILLLIIIVNIIKINDDYTCILCNNEYTTCTIKNNIIETIPNNIYQTHKSMEYVKTKPSVLNAINSWKTYADKYKFNYYFYNNDECEQFIKENFNEDVYRAYMKLPLSVMKADFWRYCIIYKNGGIYADADTVCKYDPNILLKHNHYMVIVPENKTHLCNWIFAAPKNSPILKTVIDLSTEKILNINIIKGEHIIHNLTGPGLLTEGIELYLKNNNYHTFKNKNCYANYCYPELYVFKPRIFHKKYVVHLFMGQDDDGWTLERDKKLK